MDKRIVAIRADDNVGRGSCSTLDECYSDSEIVNLLDSEKITSDDAAVSWAYDQEGLQREQALNARAGEPDDVQLASYREWQAVTAEPVEVLATLTTRERRRGAWQIWLQGKCFDAVGATAGDPYDVEMSEGRAVVLFHEHGRRNVHAHGSSNRCVIDMTSKAVAECFGPCTVEVTAEDGNLIITRV